MGIVHGLLRLRLPGRVSGGVIREYADDFHPVEILERRALEIGQLTSDDEMAQLLRGIIWHISVPNAMPGEQNSRRAPRPLSRQGAVSQIPHTASLTTASPPPLP